MYKIYSLFSHLIVTLYLSICVCIHNQMKEVSYFFHKFIHYGWLTIRWYTEIWILVVIHIQTYLVT